MSVILAIFSGAVLGYFLQRGDFCFHSTLRGLVGSPRNLLLWRAYLLTLVVAIPSVQGMIALGWIEPWIPPWAWQANVAGGLLFGVGMVIAATCVTGLFYKLGHGMLGTLVGLAAWATGDVLTYRGPLAPLRDTLNRNPIAIEGNSATLLNVFSQGSGLLLLIGAGVAAIYFLWRSPRPGRDRLWNWPALGLAVGGFTSLAWLLARLGQSNYTFGTSRVPTGAIEWLSGVGGAGANPWIPVALFALVPGAYLAAVSSRTLWIRGETGRRYVELALGGFLMGVGAAVSGGCNLGHSLVGVPLLSLGSITTTLSMAIGVLLADRALGLWAQDRAGAPAAGTVP